MPSNTTAATASRDRPDHAGQRLVSLPELRERFGIGYARSHLYRRVKAGTFPAPIKLGPGKFARKAWRESDILRFIEECAAGHDGGGDGSA